MLSRPVAYAVLQPEDISVVQAVYDRIVVEPCFSSGAVHREQLARYMLKMYNRGLVIPDALEGLCRIAAREKFSARRSSIDGFRFLVVEDDYIMATEASERLLFLGAEVVGPVPSISAALELIKQNNGLDGALLDVNLDGDMVYPVAGMLRIKKVPFAFVTGYEQSVLPPPYRSTAVFVKPTDWGHVAAQVAGKQNFSGPVSTRTLRS